MPGSDFPLAYHITFGTYGMRLHGDERGTVHRGLNQPGEPIIGRNEDWERVERRLLEFDPVTFTHEQRCHCEESVPLICERGGWSYQIAACRADHVHVMLAASVGGKSIRRWLKVWLGQALSELWPLQAGATWWAEAGSVKWIWDDAYLHNVYEYIRNQRTTADHDEH